MTSLKKPRNRPQTRDLPLENLEIAYTRGDRPILSRLHTLDNIGLFDKNCVVYSIDRLIR
jgi:hypothetical protein